MNPAVLCILLLFVYVSGNATVWQPAKGHKQIQIWPEGKMPDALVDKKSEYITTINWYT